MLKNNTISRQEYDQAVAQHEATKAKYSAIISQEAEVARLQGIASTLTSDINARLCCTNQLKAKVPLSPDRLMPRLP